MRKTFIITAVLVASVAFILGGMERIPSAESLESSTPTPTQSSEPASELKDIWLSDFDGNRILQLSADGNVIWQQKMDRPPISSDRYNVNVEYLTITPDGNLLTSDGDGMMVNEIDRNTHKVIWEYGIRGKQGFTLGMIEQPDKAYQLNENEVLINDGNNRRVIIVDKRPEMGGVVWQYGVTRKMGIAPGYLMGNTSARPLNGGSQIIITDTLQKKIMIVDRATKQIIWQYKKPDAMWLEHVTPAPGGFIMEDRQKNEVFEVNGAGKIVWKINRLADGSFLQYPTDTAYLANGDVLIAEAGKHRIIEVNPLTKKIVKSWGGNNPKSPNWLGFITTIAVE